jgi:hypothetical protein
MDASKSDEQGEGEGLREEENQSVGSVGSESHASSATPASASTSSVERVKLQEDDGVEKSSNDLLEILVEKQRLSRTSQEQMEHGQKCEGVALLAGGLSCGAAASPRLAAEAAGAVTTSPSFAAESADAATGDLVDGGGSAVMDADGEINSAATFDHLRTPEESGAHPAAAKLGVECAASVEPTVPDPEGTSIPSQNDAPKQDPALRRDPPAAPASNLTPGAWHMQISSGGSPGTSDQNDEANEVGTITYDDDIVLEGANDDNVHQGANVVADFSTVVTAFAVEDNDIELGRTEEEIRQVRVYSRIGLGL